MTGARVGAPRRVPEVPLCAGGGGVRAHGAASRSVAHARSRRQRPVAGSGPGGREELGWVHPAQTGGEVRRP
jgi:hypothetical protein